LKATVQQILHNSEITLCVKREDLLHPFISGNKLRKLKYNLLCAKEDDHHCLLTFGGAFSNHIAAVAYSGKESGLKTIGIIRGEELAVTNVNPTLKFAEECGMKLKFVSRDDYRRKDSPEFLAGLIKEFGFFYLLPEGGTNVLAVKGCEEILTDEDSVFDYICCAVGTGGTISGIINSSLPGQQVLGFPALKGDFLKEEILKFTQKDNWKLVSGYDFGGYGKTDENLIRFINEFYKKYHVPLDPIYTGKMLFGVMDLINQGYFHKGAKVLAIHTGGIQGVKGMNLKLKNKNTPLIEIDD